MLKYIYHLITLEAILELINCFNEATCILGFIKRWSLFTKQLFTTMVLSIFKYGSVIWDPQYAVHSDKIKSVQKQFLS